MSDLNETQQAAVEKLASDVAAGDLNETQQAAVKKLASDVAAGIAKRAFDKRARGRAQRGVEIHLREAELAAYLKLAFEMGFTTGRRSS